MLRLLRQDKQQQMSQQRDAARIAIIGKLTDVRNVRLKGKAGPEEHRLLKLTTNDGDTYVVDIGVGIKGLMGFSKGDRIIAVGNSARINGKPVVFAKYIGPAHEVGRAGSAS